MQPKKLRKNPTAKGITSGTVAAIARGVVAPKRPAVLAKKNGGQYQLSQSWAKYHLKMADWRPYAATSDRTVPTPQVSAHL